MCNLKPSPLLNWQGKTEERGVPPQNIGGNFGKENNLKEMISFYFIFRKKFEWEI